MREMAHDHCKHMYTDPWYIHTYTIRTSQLELKAWFERGGLEGAYDHIKAFFFFWTSNIHIKEKCQLGALGTLGTGETPHNLASFETTSRTNRNSHTLWPLLTRAGSMRSSRRTFPQPLTNCSSTRNSPSGVRGNSRR